MSGSRVCGRLSVFPAVHCRTAAMLAAVAAPAGGFAELGLRPARASDTGGESSGAGSGGDE